MTTEAQRRASRNWNKRNCEKIREYARKKYNNDTEYRERRKAKQREYYQGLDDETKKERREQASNRTRDRYHNDTTYREKAKQRALARYYRLKAEKENKDV